MTEEELRQAVVFAARFEFFDQMFKPPGAERAELGGTLDSMQINGQAVPENWRLFPLLDPERVKRYWLRVVPEGWAGPYPLHWCGCFALWCWQEAGLTEARAVKVPQGWLRFVDECKQLEPRELPKPGDCAYFSKNQHHAIVVEVDEKRRTFDTIDGNQPAIRIRKGRALRDAHSFFSIQPLIDAKLSSATV